MGEPEDDLTDALTGVEASERAAAAASVGARANPGQGVLATLAGLVSSDPDPRVREVALGALARHGAALAPDDLRARWDAATRDPDARVRRRAAEVAPAIAGTAPAVVAARLETLLSDSDVLVAEAAAFAWGELSDLAVEASAVSRLAEVATDHDDALVREAAVAALGAVGHPDGLPAILHALDDRPQIRRRAVLALAPYEGPEIEEALERALEDRDWQVRQAAEDLHG